MSDISYIAHHGIKGQKWGVRRYQNADGTLTSEGKNRYGDGQSSSKSSNHSKLKTAAKVAAAAAITGAVAYGVYKKGGFKAAGTAAKRVGSVVQKAKTPGSPHARYKDLSDEEIQARIGRLQSEIKLAELAASANTTSGRKFMIDVGRKSMDKAAVAFLGGTAYAVGKHYMEDYLGYTIPRLDKK